MSRNPQLRYQDILVATDQEAREDYEFDPRVQFYGTELRGPEEPGYEQSNARTTAADADAPYDLEGCEDKEDEQEDDRHAKRNDCKSVQPPPKMITKKMVVVMDTAQRDWTLQPNAYQVSMKFGSPAISNASSVQRVPVYQNSRYIPINADENSNQVFFQPNIAGFTISTIGSFPPYDPFAGPGRIITYEIISNTSNIVNPGNGFYTNKVLSNVESLKLARATLPHRRFTNLAPDILPGPGQSASIGFVANPTTSFMTEPYLLLFLNNYQGQYTGANDPINRAFSVLAQDRRITLLPTSPIGTQFHDYYAWSDEKYEFTSPETYIKSFDVTLTKNTGMPYIQLDDIAITSFTAVSGINFDPFILGPPYPIVIFECAITRTQDSNNSIYYNRNELRPGDRIRFYHPALCNLLMDPSLNASPYSSDYSNLFTWLLNNDVYVLSNVNFGIINTNGPDFYDRFQFAYDPINTYGQTTGYAPINLSAFDPFLNVVTQTSSGTPIPILNTNVQATFAFEVFTKVPDTSHLSSAPVK
jgi:hypothetical protein